MCEGMGVSHGLTGARLCMMHGCGRGVYVCACATPCAWYMGFFACDPNTAPTDTLGPCASKSKTQTCAL